MLRYYFLILASQRFFNYPKKPPLPVQRGLF
jgi:hypothetical protein